MTELAMPNEKAPWTEERVETLKKLWADGLSASQIAGRLGMGVTRNAVIGKVHRLNLSGRATPPRNAQPRTARKTPREPSAPGRSPSMPTAGANALKPFSQMAPRPMPLPEPKPLRLVDSAKPAGCRRRNRGPGRTLRKRGRSRAQSVDDRSRHVAGGHERPDRPRWDSGRCARRAHSAWRSKTQS